MVGNSVRCQISCGQENHGGDILDLQNFEKGIVSTMGEILPTLSPMEKISLFSVGLNIILYVA